MKEPIFRVYDNERKVWAGEHGGRSLEDYALEDFKDAHLMYCDMEGFTLSPDGDLLLHDECGNFVYCDRTRFDVCYPKEYIAALTPTPSGNYLVEPREQQRAH